MKPLCMPWTALRLLQRCIFVFQLRESERSVILTYGSRHMPLRNSRFSKFLCFAWQFFLFRRGLQCCICFVFAFSKKRAFHDAPPAPSPRTNVRTFVRTFVWTFVRTFVWTFVRGPLENFQSISNRITFPVHLYVFGSRRQRMNALHR